MKIGLMSRWNVPCGISIHAELVGRALNDMGHKLRVFAPIEPKEVEPTQKDEPWITRNFKLFTRKEPTYLNPAPLLEADYEIFLAEGISKFPPKEFSAIFSKIKAKAKTFVVIHESCLNEFSLTPKLEWDRIICFDERFKKFISNLFPEKKIRMISYPCHPLRKGDKQVARKKLGLPLDEKIIFVYGIDAHKYLHLAPTLEKVAKEWPLRFLVITPIKEWFDLFDCLRGRYKFIDARRASLSIEDLYQCLHASDALLIHKDHSPDVVLSSVAHLCMGSGCPILAYKTNFFERFEKEVIKYGNLEELVERLRDIFEGKVDSNLKAAERYVKKNSSTEIAKKFLKLFRE
jgi:hypothetical protein